VGTGGGKDEVRRIKPGSGEGFKDAPFAPEMVVVPAGEFMMGSPSDEPERESLYPGSETPQHKVIIPHPFAVGRYAVTFAEWDAAQADKDWQRITGIDARRGNDWDWGRGDRPAIKVSWEDAQAYAKWLSEKTGKEYRLLSEAEWEYAARAGTTTPFWWGKAITPDHANYDGNYTYDGGGKKGEYREKTVPVKSFKPNPWGLYQVHGNVQEWCEDVWNDNYNGAPTDGSAWTAGDSSRRVLRGGSWLIFPRFLRSANRSWWVAGYRVNWIGFRLSRTNLIYL
jgi:formylglycine-generating enzyme required for sulfatase activity